MAESISCFHCGLPADTESHIPSISFKGRDRYFCCHGCSAVCQSIIDSGLADFYDYRDSKSPTLSAKSAADILEKLSLYDREEVQTTFVSKSGDILEASLILEDIRCPACLWLNENHIRKQPGVLEVAIDSASYRMRVKWDAQQTRLSQILKAIQDIGYVAHPCDFIHINALNKKRKTRSIQRILFAGLLGMMVMNFSIASYVLIADAAVSRPIWYILGSWTSLFVSTVLLAYPAQDFWLGAWHDIKNKRLGMDIPIVLGLSTAYLGSLYSLITQKGDIYFDSIAMFIFFILLARYFETKGRVQAASYIDRLQQITPESVERFDADSNSWQFTSVLDINAGDILRVLPGQTLMVDGVIKAGESHFNEALLTGENVPVAKKLDNTVYSGSINQDQIVEIKVINTGNDAMINQMKKLVENGMMEKPELAITADKIAGYFVPGIILLALVTASIGLINNHEYWLANTIAVLIVTCPCALGLATPVAMSVSTGALISNGIMPVKQKSLETVTKVTHLYLDKTGTLTEGNPGLESLMLLEDKSEQRCLEIAASLAQYSHHPISEAISLVARNGQISLQEPDHVRHENGVGIYGEIQQAQYLLGKKPKEGSLSSAISQKIDKLSAEGKLIAFLSNKNTVLAVFVFADKLREDAYSVLHGEVLQRIQQKAILSGDLQPAVARTAAELSISRFYSQMSPTEKYNFVKQSQEKGEVVMMFGDGLNDAPTLASANVSASFSVSSDLAKISSDFIFMQPKFEMLEKLFVIAHKTRKIIIENYIWALSYNAIAIPLAMAGYVPPWAAAIGMSVSSLIVVINALRLKNLAKKEVMHG